MTQPVPVSILAPAYEYSILVKPSQRRCKRWIVQIATVVYLPPQPQPIRPHTGFGRIHHHERVGARSIRVRVAVD